MLYRGKKYQSKWELRERIESDIEDTMRVLDFRKRSKLLRVIKLLSNETESIIEQEQFFKRVK